MTHELSDPLQPLLAVHLSSTAKGLREAMEEQLAELKGQRQGAAAAHDVNQLSQRESIGQCVTHELKLIERL